MTSKLATIAHLIMLSALISCLPNQPAAPSAPVVSNWSVFRHEYLGIEIQYPTGWRVDSTSAYVYFCDTPQATECFDIVNASFEMQEPIDFLAHLGPPVEMTRTLTMDSQPALLVTLRPVPESQGIKNVVAVITPYGRELTIGNRTSSEIFDRALASVRFFKPKGMP